MKPLFLRHRVFLFIPVFILLAAVFMVTAPTAKADSNFSGSGSSGDPYQITNAADLSKLATLVNAGDSSYNSAYYMQKNDIDLSGVSDWTSIGTSDNPFCGTFDGNGNSITELNINLNVPAEVHPGLFGVIDGGSVENLDIGNGNIKVTFATYKADYQIDAGSIAGKLTDGFIDNCDSSVGFIITVNDNYYPSVGGICGVSTGSSIENCSYSGNMNLSGSTFDAGGISGEIWDGTMVSGCLNKGTINSDAKGGGGRAGGICGFSNFSSPKNTIELCSNSAPISIFDTDDNDECGGILGWAIDVNIVNCFNAGSINNGGQENGYAGGIVGYIDDTDISVQDCYNVGPVGIAGVNVNTGGITGYKNPSATVSECYCLDICDNESGGGGTGGVTETIGEMKSADGYSGFDFDNVWTMEGAEETGYFFAQLKEGQVNAYNHHVNLTVNSSVYGSVQGAGDYDYLDTVTITATPKDGYTFKNWAVTSGGATLADPSSPTTTFVMLSDVSVTAVFEGQKFTVTVQKDGTGNVTGDGTYTWGDTVSISATGTGGNEFMYWEVISGGAVIADILDMTTVLTMPNSDVVLKAHFAANPTGYTYTVSNEKATITGYPYGATTLTIPYKLGGYRVTGIAYNLFRNNTTLIDVTLPYTLETIGNYAFYGCYNLTGTMTFPDGMVSIGDNAFNHCVRITALDFGDSNVFIGNSAFNACAGITALDFGGCKATIDEAAFCACTGITALNLGNVQRLGDYAFSGCTNLVSTAGDPLVIPDSVAGIGDRAFDGCKLASVTMGKGVSSVGNQLFINCPLNSLTVDPGNPYIKSINNILFNDSGTELIYCPDYRAGAYAIPQGVTSIRDYAFYECQYVNEISIPDSVLTIGNYAFYSCKFNTLTIPDSVTKIGDYAFYYCSITGALTIPDSVKSIGDYAFYNCININSLKLSANMESIGDYAFCYCPHFSNLTIPDSIKSIGDYAFYDCSLYYGLTLGSGVEGIGNYAFSKTEMSTVSIPASVKSVGNNAFYQCSNLTSAYFLGTKPSFGTFVFHGSATGFKVYFNIRNCTSWSSYTDYTSQAFCMLTKDLQDGSNPQSIKQNLDSNGLMLQPSDPSRTGYIFVGWYKEKQCVNQWDFSKDTVTDDITLYAKWTGNNYTVTFNPGIGGTVDPSSIQVSNGATYGDLPTPVKAGYDFSGWYTGTNGSGTPISESGIVNLSSGITLYANWIAKTYYVTFDPGSGGTVDPGSIQVTYNSTFGTLPTPVRAGYNFSGWYTGVNGVGTHILNTNTVNITTDTLLYAKWSVITYQITYDLSQGSVGKPNKTTYTIETPSFILNDPTKTGYNFTGWTTPGNTTPNTSVTVSTGTYGNLSFTANWTPASYTINFSVGSDATVSPLSKTVKYDGTFGELPIPAYNGYLFYGWYTGSGGAGTNITSESIVNITSGITLYAKWSVITYTIAYDLAGGSVSQSNKIAYTVETPNFILNNPTKAGYNFIGWTTASDTVPSKSMTICEGSYGDLSFTANWIAASYTINFNAGTGGILPYSKKQVTYGEPYGDLPVPTKSGYYFEGWYTGNNGMGTLIKNADIVNIAADSMLYAKWVKYSAIALSAPTLTVSSTDYKTITLKWKTVNNAQGYLIYRSAGNTKHYTQIKDTKDLSYTDTGLTKGTKYYYYVKAYRTPYMITIYSTSAAKYAVPAWPSITLKPTAMDFDSIELNWNAVAGASGYEVYRSSTAKGKYVYIGESTVNTYTDDTAVTGVTYYYEVRAYDMVNGEKTYSSYCPYKSAHTVPDITASLLITPSGTTITVSWNAAGGATGYEVYRATSLKGKYSRIAVTSNLSFNDLNRAAGRTYYYKVRAYCKAGKTIVYGNYSGIQTLSI